MTSPATQPNHPRMAAAYESLKGKLDTLARGDITADAVLSHVGQMLALQAELQQDQGPTSTARMPSTAQLSEIGRQARAVEGPHILPVLYGQAVVRFFAAVNGIELQEPGAGEPAQEPDAAATVPQALPSVPLPALPEDAPAALRRHREQYGDLSEVMQRAARWRIAYHAFQRPAAPGADKPVTDADVDAAEAELLSSIRDYARAAIEASRSLSVAPRPSREAAISALQAKWATCKLEQDRGYLSAPEVVDVVLASLAVAAAPARQAALARLVIEKDGGPIKHAYLLSELPAGEHDVYGAPVRLLDDDDTRRLAAVALRESAGVPRVCDWQDAALQVCQAVLCQGLYVRREVLEQCARGAPEALTELAAIIQRAGEDRPDPLTDSNLQERFSSAIEHAFKQGQHGGAAPQHVWLTFWWQMGQRCAACAEPLSAIQKMLIAQDPILQAKLKHLAALQTALADWKRVLEAHRHIDAVACVFADMDSTQGWFELSTAQQQASVRSGGLVAIRRSVESWVTQLGPHADDPALKPVHAHMMTMYRWLLDLEATQ